MSSKLFDMTNGDILSLFLDSVEFNYCVIDRDGNYLIQNNKMIESISHGAVRAADIDQPSWEHCKEVMKLGEKVMKEEPFKGRYYLSIKQPLFDKGQCIGIRVLSFDVTDRKRVEQLAKGKEAEKLALTTAFAGFIAHEVRTPLGTIRLQMEALRNINVNFDVIPTKERNDFMQDLTDRVIKIIDKTTYIIDEMLKKVRSFATGEIYYDEYEEVSITSDVENLLNTYPFKKNEQNLIKISYDARFKYLGNKVLTAHVLSNLMKNALYAIENSGKTDADITIETKTENDFNLLIFKDTATGIPQNFVDKIFDQFETKKDLQNGAGLGLAYCKMIMQGYGGDIICETRLGEYTKLILRFPKVQTKV